ncbi:MAG: 2'-5' RNA ligase family protein [Bacteroidota bacterium]|nr:2'-5' RNA ligase family protein [Bacteroidota bacterium]
MKTENFIRTSAHGCHEYLLIVKPAKEINEKLIAEKQVFYDDYKEKNAIESIPQIAVASFLAKEGMENTVIRWMQKICSKQHSFSVTLNNYSGFPPDTIYLRIQNVNPFLQLAKELSVVNAYLNSSSCQPVLFTPKPHINIAGKLPKEVFFKALIQYAHKSFHESFLVNELLLLKRRDEHDEFKTVIVFALQPATGGLTN